MESKENSTPDVGDSKKLSKKERRAAKVQGRPKAPEAADNNKDAGIAEKVKTKAELKAERRAKQEAQRAAKAEKKAEQASNPKAKQHSAPANIQVDDPRVQKKKAKNLEKQQVPQRAEGQKKVAFFSHLHQYERSLSLTENIRFGSDGIHPAVIRLGLQYAEGKISGSNARCAALLHALCQFIAEYETPPQKELSRHLESKLKQAISYLDQCRPLSISMGSAIKYVKQQLSNIPSDMSDKQAKEKLMSSFRDFVHVNINLAGKAISVSAQEKIKDGDVVMVYGSSSLVTRVLCDAHASGKRFRVMVVDGRPKLSGCSTLKRLAKAGIHCSYVLVSAASYVMPEVTKVMLGAHGFLSNGYVMGSVGTAMVAMAARSRGVPVIVCCEAYKFCDRVQTDSIVNNEIGDPMSVLVTHNSKSKDDSPLLQDDAWNKFPDLKALHLTYDVTPPNYIAMVVTELGKLPCTSVPVVLRVRSLDT